MHRKPYNITVRIDDNVNLTKLSFVLKKVAESAENESIDYLYAELKKNKNFIPDIIKKIKKNLGFLKHLV